MKNIYQFFWDAGGWGSGVLLIAADSAEEAKEIAREESEHWYFYMLREDIAYLKEQSGIVLINCYQE